MPRYKIDVVWRPCDGKFEFTAYGTDEPCVWTREEVEETAARRLGPGRLVENVDGCFWQTAEPETPAQQF